MAWDEVSLPFFVSFVAWLRTAVPAEVRRLPAGDQPAGPAKSAQASSAKAVCGRCEVDKNCLSYALETMPHGIWGEPSGKRGLLCAFRRLFRYRYECHATSTGREAGNPGRVARGSRPRTGPARPASAGLAGSSGCLTGSRRGSLAMTSVWARCSRSYQAGVRGCDAPDRMG